MAFTPTQEAQILAMLTAFTNGKTISAMTAATDINEQESIEISQNGNSKKATLELALKNRLFTQEVGAVVLSEVDSFINDGQYKLLMATAGDAVNGEESFTLLVSKDSEGKVIQLQITESWTIFSRGSNDGGLAWSAWKLIADDQGLKLDKTSVKNIGGESETDVLSQAFVTQALSDVDEALSFKDAYYHRTSVTAADMDTYIQAGHHEIVTLNPPTNLINGASKFRLDVSKPDATTGEIIQTQTTTDGKIYHRSRSDAGVWTAWKLIASDVSNFTTDAEFATAIADEKAVSPQVAFNKRVVADGGTVRSKAFMQRVFEANKDLLADTELLFVPEAGMKVTDGKIEKLYNLVGTNDAVQATAGNRFYAGSGIADNEKASIKAVLGQGNASLGFTPVAFESSDSWTAIMNLKLNKNGFKILFGTSYLLYSASNEFRISNGSYSFLGADFPIQIGENVNIEFGYSNGRTELKLNGISITPSAYSCGMTFSEIALDIAFQLDGYINYFQVLSKPLSAHESQSLHSFLSTEFPPIETIAVGSQQVATSNLEATVFGGTIVPEVQRATGVEKVVNGGFDSSDSWSENANAFVSGGVMNFVNVSAFGGSTQLKTFEAGLYKITFTIVSITSGSVRIGISDVNTNSRNTAGTYTEYLRCSAGSNIYLTTAETGTNATIDNVSILEVGWSDLTTPAWCHYDNSPANGAIYGKLYNGFAVPVINTYAPQGFHVPSELEWTMLSEYLGGDTVSGGKLKALYGGFDNGFSTNESGVSAIPGGARGIDGVFSNANNYSYWRASNGETRLTIFNDSSPIVISNLGSVYGMSVRLFSNTPHLEKLTYDSGWFATDISSSPKSVRIPFSRPVKSITIKSTTSLTSIEAKLFSYNGTELETLITGKACNATTKTFNITADQTMSYTDSYVRVTCVGNSGNGMQIEINI